MLHLLIHLLLCHPLVNHTLLLNKFDKIIEERSTSPTPFSTATAASQVKPHNPQTDNRDTPSLIPNL